MHQQALTAGVAALLLSAAAGAGAQTIPFSTVRFEATTIALTSDGPVGYDAQSGLLPQEPVSSSAGSVGAVDAATAGAIVGPGLLNTSVDVSASGVSSAVATSHFMGSFTNAGPVSLRLDFTGLDFATGSGGAATTLYVSLTSNGATLFADYVQGAWQFAYTPAVGTTSLLDLTLTSDASAAFLNPGTGNASGFGMVTIAGSVPEVSSWLLFALGLGALGTARLHARRRSAAG